MHSVLSCPIKKRSVQRFVRFRSLFRALTTSSVPGRFLSSSSSSFCCCCCCFSRGGGGGRLSLQSEIPKTATGQSCCLHHRVPQVRLRTGQQYSRSETTDRVTLSTAKMSASPRSTEGNKLSGYQSLRSRTIRLRQISQSTGRKCVCLVCTCWLSR